MLGLAQKMYLEKQGSLLKEGPLKGPIFTQWKTLSSLLLNGSLGYIDLSIAQRVLKDYPQADESVAAFLCHLSIAIQQGHLCIKVDENEIHPDPFISWSLGIDQTQDHPGDKISQEDFKKISSLIKMGAENIPPALMTIIDENNTLDLNPSTPLCRLGNLYYFQRYWHHETRFLRRFSSLYNQPLSIPINMEKAHSIVNAMLASKQLLEEQSEAIVLACQRPISIICGGPGTGKTYTAGQIINILWQSLPEIRRKDFKIALAAPTGKAAANLHKSMRKATESLQELPKIEARTLHSLLGVRPGKTNKTITSLSADLVIIDECSMIDVQMMGYLFESIKPGSRVILLGDNRQLPSVEAGNIFAELLEVASTSKSNVNYSVKLNKCMRAELKDIVDFSHAVNDGDSSKAKWMLSNPSENSGVRRLLLGPPESSSAATTQKLLEYSSPYFSLSNTEVLAPEQLLESFNQFRLLSPLRKGPYGVEELNRIFLKHFLKSGRKNREFIAPIMVVKNDARLDLVNGEIGLLVRSIRTEEETSLEVKHGDYAWFPSKDGKIPLRKLPALILPHYEYAYCISVHKSQGSEFNHVLLMLPEGSEYFGREVLYTAVTRARKKLDVWTEDAVLQETIDRQSLRLSGIGIRLKSQLSNKS
jgi:exodeoxyribonuclease V alpha subunit